MSDVALAEARERLCGRCSSRFVACLRVGGYPTGGTEACDKAERCADTVNGCFEDDQGHGWHYRMWLMPALYSCWACGHQWEEKK